MYAFLKPTAYSVHDITKKIFSQFKTETEIYFLRNNYINLASAD